MQLVCSTYSDPHSQTNDQFKGWDYCSGLKLPTTCMVLHNLLASRLLTSGLCRCCFLPISAHPAQAVCGSPPPFSGEREKDPEDKESPYPCPLSLIAISLFPLQLALNGYVGTIVNLSGATRRWRQKSSNHVSGARIEYPLIWYLFTAAIQDRFRKHIKKQAHEQRGKTTSCYIHSQQLVCTLGPLIVK